MGFKVAIIAALTASVSAHMSMIEPCSRYTPHNSKCPPLPAGASYDYSLNSPLEANAPLCKYTTPYDTPVETWTAGQSVTVKFDTSSGAAHGGGHCQFSLSYDGGKSFFVVHEELKHCFFNGPSNGNIAEVTSYTFNLPNNLPSSEKAVFAWSWVNAIGNREFYMNCADVAIKGNSKFRSSSFTGKQMTIANHAGYPTIPEFGGDYDTGIEHYQNSKQVTVNGDGSGSSSSESSSDSSGTIPEVSEVDFSSEESEVNSEESEVNSEESEVNSEESEISSEESEISSEESEIISEDSEINSKDDESSSGIQGVELPQPGSSAPGINNEIPGYNTMTNYGYNVARY